MNVELVFHTAYHVTMSTAGNIPDTLVSTPLTRLCGVGFLIFGEYLILKVIVIFIALIAEEKYPGLEGIIWLVLLN